MRDLLRGRLRARLPLREGLTLGVAQFVAGVVCLTLGDAGVALALILQLLIASRHGVLGASCALGATALAALVHTLIPMNFASVSAAWDFQAWSWGHFGFWLVATFAVALAGSSHRRALARAASALAQAVSERDLGNRLLAESERRLVLALDATAAGVFDIAIPSLALTLNDRVFELWGMEKSDTATFEQFMQGVHPDDREALNAVVQRVFVDGHPGPFSMRYRVVNRRDQSVIHVQSDARVVVEDGVPLRAVGLVRDVTDYQRAIEAAQTSEARQSAFFNNAKLVGWMKDVSGNYVFASSGLLDRTGLPLDAVLGKSDREIWPPHTGAFLANGDKSVLDDGVARERVEQLTSADGTRSCWLTKRFAFSDVGGHRFVGGVAVDITSRCDAEAKLRDSEALFRRLVELSPDTIIVIRNRLLEFISPGGRELFGVDVLSDWIGVSVMDAVPADCQAFALAQLGALEDGKSMPPTEFTLLRADGTPALVEAAAVPFQDHKGMAILAQLRNVAVRKAIESARLESDARLRAFLDVSGLFAWMKDSEGRYVYLSGTCARLNAGFSNQMLGMRSLDAWPAPAAESFEAADRVVLQDGRPYESIHEGRDANGVPISLLCVRFPFLDHNGRQFVGGVALDISESRRVLAARDELRDWSRTLQKGQEEERRRLARELHDEFGSMLAVLKSQVALFANQANANSEIGKQYVVQINSLIDSLLDATDRAVEGLRPPVLEHLGLCAAIERLALRFGDDYPIAVELDLPSVAPTLDDDQTLALYRILQECLTNIAKHSGASQAIITLRVDEGSIVLSVSDDGKGADDLGRRAGGYGFVGMRERAGLVGGTLTVGSSLPRGLQVVARVPLSGPAPDLTHDDFRSAAAS